MRKSLLCAAAVIGLAVAGTSATAGDSDRAAPAGTEATGQAQGAKEEPKQICRTVVMTGTRIRRHKKVCATPEEWQSTSDAIADDFRGLSGNPMIPETSNVPS